MTLHDCRDSFRSCGDPDRSPLESAPGWAFLPAPARTLLVAQASLRFDAGPRPVHPGPAADPAVGTAGQAELARAGALLAGPSRTGRPAIPHLQDSHHGSG